MSVTDSGLTFYCRWSEFGLSGTE